MPNYKIFISYRRKGGFDTAKLIYDRLRMDGYSVSFDIDTLENGNFDNELEKRIKKCKDFILILSPGIFECFSEENYNPKDDWVRLEIAYAINKNKNIVPLVLENFIYPRELPTDIKDIARKNSIDLNPKYFEAAYEKMKETFLISKPNWQIRHKKRVRIFFTTVIFFLVAFLFFKLYTDFGAKIKEAEMRAQRTDSIRIARELEIVQKESSINIIKDSEFALIIDSINAHKDKEIARVIDSTKAAKEKELARVIDSMNKVQRIKIARATDSIKQYMKQQSQANAQKTSAQKTATQKTTTQKNTTQKSSKK